MAPRPPRPQGRAARGSRIPGGPPILTRWTALAWAVVLAVSAWGYWATHALLHFLWHLGYGSAAGLALAGVWTLVRRRPAGHAALWALGGYGFMVVPDLLWALPLLARRSPWEHEHWMDLFLGHVALDAWPFAGLALVPVLAGSLLFLGWARARTGRPGFGLLANHPRRN